MPKMSHKHILIVIACVAVISLFVQFIYGSSFGAQVIITIMGAYFVLVMLAEMIQTIRHGQYGVDLLAILAIVSTLAVGEHWAALIILIMLVGGDALEDYATNKANTELKALLDNSPQVAHRISGDQITTITVNEVAVGDQLLIKPGEVVPVDGTVISGVSNVDESSLTGEARPQPKQPQAPLMSGSVNGDHAITMQATQLAADSQFQQLVKLVQHAKNTPARFVRLADRYAVPFTIVAVLLAFGAAIIAKSPQRFAEVLVVASPCPLILAAPVALVSGMSRASRNGIVVKTGDVIEKLARAKTVAFDKTGTITNGHLSVADVTPVDGIDKQQLLQLAASVEQHSNHVLARSLVEYAQANDVTLLPVNDVQEITANGVQATLNGQLVQVGKRKFILGDQVVAPTKNTAIYVRHGEQYLGRITFQDQIRPEAALTMQSLQQHGVTKLMMLSGDQTATANRVAELVGINDVRAELLPEAKIAALASLTPAQRPAVMVGDGVNDAPSLATADVGIAMGAHGSSAASESADLVILKDDLAKVATAVTIAQATMRVAKQAVLIGLGICLILMVIAAFGVIPAIIGAMFQEVIDTVSILWALRARSARNM